MPPWGQCWGANAVAHNLQAAHSAQLPKHCGFLTQEVVDAALEHHRRIGHADPTDRAKGTLQHKINTTLVSQLQGADLEQLFLRQFLKHAGPCEYPVSTRFAIVVNSRLLI